VYRKIQRFTVIDGYYLTTEIIEVTEDTEILMFYLRLISADSAISVLKIHFFDSLKSEDGLRVTYPASHFPNCRREVLFPIIGKTGKSGNEDFTSKEMRK